MSLPLYMMYMYGIKIDGKEELDEAICRNDELMNQLVTSTINYHVNPQPHPTFPNGTRRLPEPA